MGTDSLGQIKSRSYYDCFHGYYEESDASSLEKHRHCLDVIMCTIICTMRTVLWYVMSIVGTLLILVALFTNKWLEGKMTAKNLSSVDSFIDSTIDLGTKIVQDGANNIDDLLDESVGLFTECEKMRDHNKFFDGECIPKVDHIKTVFENFDDKIYPHAWRGAVLCFAF